MGRSGETGMLDGAQPVGSFVYYGDLPVVLMGISTYYVAEWSSQLPRHSSRFYASYQTVREVSLHFGNQPPSRLGEWYRRYVRRCHHQ